MSPQILPVHPHRQDDPTWCGAACAQMVLAFAGLPLDLPGMDQRQLYDSNHNQSSENNLWLTAPDGLLATLNGFLPGRYDTYSFSSTDAAVTQIVQSIQRGVPSIALIWFANELHWVVVVAYYASPLSGPPSGPLDGVHALYVFNPWGDYWNRPKPAPPGDPPPHKVQDWCGSGGVLGDTLPISVADFSLAQVNVGRKWFGKFVMLGASGLAIPIEPALPEVALDNAALVTVGETALLPAAEAMAHRSRGIRKPAQAFRDAKAALEYSGLRTHVVWGSRVGTAEPREQHAPLLVQRLDRPEDFYYIVVLYRGRLPTLLTCVDARTGEWLESLPLQHETRPRSNATNIARIERLAVRAGQALRRRERITVSGSNESVTLWPGGACHYPTLVWKPCRESPSAFAPS